MADDLTDRKLWEAGCLTRAQLMSWTDADLASHSAGIRKTLKLLFETLDARTASPPAPALDELKPVEVWCGDRKVSVYQNEVIRVWGADIEDEMSSEQRDLETVQDAFDWLYDEEKPRIAAPALDARTVETVAEALQNFWQGPSGRTWAQCNEKLPPQADWFRQLARVAIRADRDRGR